jgi:serine/threonine-protein kinase
VAVLLEAFLRARTRESATATIARALGDAGLAPAKRGAARSPIATRANDGLRGPILGLAAIGVAFAALAAGIELSGPRDRGAANAQGAPLLLAPEGAGALRVVATPWAEVKVDGQYVDTTPFARPIPLAPGKHWITLRHPDAPEERRELTIAPGETAILDVTMNVGEK